MATAANLDPNAFWVLWELKGRPDEMLQGDLPLPVLLAVPKSLFPIKEWEDFWNVDDVPEQGTPEALEWMLSGKWKETKPVPSVILPMLRSGHYFLEFVHRGDETPNNHKVGFCVHMPPEPPYSDNSVGSPGYTGPWKQVGGRQAKPRPRFNSEIISFEEALEAIRYCATIHGDL